MPIPTTPIDLAGPSARDVVYERLLRLIVTGALQPGARIGTDELLALTASRRAPLREALTALEGVGLVTVAPRQFTQVTGLDARRAREAMTLHGAYVTQAIKDAAEQLSDDDTESLARIDVDGDRAAIMHALASLCDIVLERTGNRYFAQLASTLRPFIDRALLLQAVDLPTADWARAVRDLRDTLVARDRVAAVEAWGRQLDLTMSALPAEVGATARRTSAREVAPTLRQKVADTLTAAILDGTLVPGEALRESELTAWLGVSRTPVREALVQLQMRGLVELPDRRPAQVVRLDDAGFRDAMRALGVLRVLALRESMLNDAIGTAQKVTAVIEAWVPSADPAIVVAMTTQLSEILEKGSADMVLQEVSLPLTARVRWQAAREPFVVTRLDPEPLDHFARALRDGRIADAEEALWQFWDLPPVTAVDNGLTAVASRAATG